MMTLLERWKAAVAKGASPQPKFKDEAQ